MALTWTTDGVQVNYRWSTGEDLLYRFPEIINFSTTNLKNQPMKTHHFFPFLPAVLLLLFGSCLSTDDGRDPSKPVKVMQPGDYWVTHFDEGEFQNGVIRNGKLYCNTINPGKAQDYFYCFNLQTGKVDWKHPVEAWASQPAIVSQDGIFYATFVGELHCLTLDGQCKWQRRFGPPYGSHYRDVRTGNLVVLSVVSGVWEYDHRDGSIVSKSRDLQREKAYLAREKKKRVPIRPYVLKVPAADGIRELEISSGHGDLHIQRKAI
jgi:hypothetical protein